MEQIQLTLTRATFEAITPHMALQLVARSSFRPLTGREREAFLGASPRSLIADAYGLKDVVIIIDTETSEFSNCINLFWTDRFAEDQANICIRPLAITVEKLV